MPRPPGDILNVLGTFTFMPTTSTGVSLPTITIDAKANLLILHPDILITATALSNAPRCRRKPLLSNLVRSSSDVTPALIWGNILHEVMQSCLLEKRWDEEWVDQKIDNAVNQGLGELLRVNMGIEQAKREVKARARGLKGFSQKYLSDRPKVNFVFVLVFQHSNDPVLQARSSGCEYASQGRTGIAPGNHPNLRYRGRYMVTNLWHEREARRVRPRRHHREGWQQPFFKSSPSWDDGELANAPRNQDGSRCSGDGASSPDDVVHSLDG